MRTKCCSVREQWQSAYNRICATIQITRENCDPIRPGRQESRPALLSTDFIDNSVGRNMPSLDVLYQPTPSEGNATRAERILCNGSETLSREDSKDGTNSIVPSSNSKSHIFETKRENIEVHVRCVDSLQTSEQGSASIESKNNKDITIGFEACPNQRTIGELQTSFGKLFRIGTMGDVTWTTEIPTKPCCFVFAHPCPTQEVRRTIESHESMLQVSKCEGQDEALCTNKLVVVDTFANESDRRHLASFIGCELPNDGDDPKELEFYIQRYSA
ncbi:9963_t:CDS:2 [Ambispora leptoticha]|uniref:9963_t:CDS:1 n=1 Tax=Ambispora leptoticha TaxID=144679 RepID=A0A9N8VEM5_9GLOM|nr:9963_t:CDS:2 [Ambispora leptoticha]